MALEQELQTYYRELPNLREQEGEFILIHHRTVAGVWDTLEQALDAGYERFGPGEPFLVKKLQAEEKPVLLPYDLSLFPHATPIPAAHGKLRGD